jgi:hypothetical protein
MVRIDRLFTTAEAGRELGLTSDAVCKLARDGKIEVVTQVVRGEGKSPRKYVRASELQRYIRELNDSTKQVEPNRGKKIRRAGLAKEIAQAKSYV